MVADINVEDAFDCTVRVCEYWADGNDKFKNFMYDVDLGFLSDEVIPELEQEFNISK